jgi:hypothetical protein
LFQFILNDKFGDLTIGIVEISKHSDSRHTGGHTGWLPALLNKFDTKPTFFDIALFFYDPDIIGAGGNAIFATDAFIFVNQNHSVFPLIGGSRGTNLYARRIVTMLALNREKFAGVIREFPVLSLLKMIVSLLFCKTVLVMAGHPTGMTTYALRFINYHSISSHESLPIAFFMSSRTCFGIS